MKLKEKQHGQGLVEYALILIGVAIVVVLVLNITGVSVRDIYCQAIEGLGGRACEDAGACSFAFDSPSDLDSWEGENKEDLVLEDERACIIGDGKEASSYLNPACSSSLISSDYSIILSGVTIDQAVDNNKNTGLDTWFRAQDDENGYLFIYNSRTNYVRFWKIVDGNWIRLSQAKVPESWQSQELNFKIDVQGENFTAYQAGELILQASDSAYPEGEVGIRNKPSSKSCIGDIRVE
jgi:hypothetical protein